MRQMLEVTGEKRYSSIFVLVLWHALTCEYDTYAFVRESGRVTT